MLQSARSRCAPRRKGSCRTAPRRRNDRTPSRGMTTTAMGALPARKAISDRRGAKNEAIAFRALKPPLRRGAAAPSSGANTARPGFARPDCAMDSLLDKLSPKPRRRRDRNRVSLVRGPAARLEERYNRCSFAGRVKANCAGADTHTDKPGLRAQLARQGAFGVVYVRPGVVHVSTVVASSRAAAKRTIAAQIVRPPPATRSAMLPRVPSSSLTEPGSPN